MATPGSGRHTRPGAGAAGGRRWWPIAGIALVVGLAVAAVAGVTLAHTWSGPPRAVRGHQVTAVRVRPAPRFCPAGPSGPLRADLAQAVAGSQRAEVQPLGVSATGADAYVSTWSRRFTGVAELDLATGALRRIRAFARPVTDQADGTASGDWLVWAQTYSLSSLDRFTMYAWNAAAGRLRRLGRSGTEPGGQPWPSPWHAPAVGGHYAAWAQGYGPGGLVEVRLANLDTGQVTTIRRGHAQPPLFDGGLVVWPESDAPGTQTTLRAYSLAGRRLVPLPAALRAVHGTEFIATDGTRTAYLSPDLTRLYYSARQDQPATLALRLPAGVDFADLAMAPGVLAWTTSQATYLASTRTGAFTRVTPSYGYATGSGSVLLVTDAPGRKAVHPALPLHVINPAGITWPTCRSWQA